MLHEEIIDFINRRFSKDCHWCDGNCYWFAVILTQRFPDLDIWYLPVENHFVAGADDVYYDWTGEITPEEDIILWDNMQSYDSLLYERIVRDCLL